MDESEESRSQHGVPAWPGGSQSWPSDERFDPTLLAEGDRRNVEDRFRYWARDKVVEALDAERGDEWLEVAIENLAHDFNIGSIVRTANCLGVRYVHIVGKRRWNRRGAMVTDRYLHVIHHEDVAAFRQAMTARGRVMIGIDNCSTSIPIEGAILPRHAVLIMGEESSGLSEEMKEACERIHHITQYGSSRSMNVGHAAAIAMWAWVVSR